MMAAPAIPGQHSRIPSQSVSQPHHNTPPSPHKTQHPTPAGLCITYTMDYDTHHPKQPGTEPETLRSICLSCLFDYDLREAIDRSACHAQHKTNEKHTGKCFAAVSCDRQRTANRVPRFLQAKSSTHDPYSEGHNRPEQH